MGDQELVARLLKEEESSRSIVDFKSESYHFDNEVQKAEFVKDIVCMANTPREGSAHILIGVRSRPNGEKDLVDISSHPDDASLQQLVSSRVRPIPQFAYRAVDYLGKKLGLIEIYASKHGPFLPTKGSGNILRTDVIYYRRGSSNEAATPEEIREIVHWMTGVPTQDVSTEADRVKMAHLMHWDEFYEGCNRFDQGWLYVLIMGPTASLSAKQKAALGRIDWSLVMDFDPDTQLSGLYRAVEAEWQAARALHLVTWEDQRVMTPTRATYWLAACGLKDRPTTLVDGDWKAWKRRHSENLRIAVTNFVKAAAEMPVTVVTVWDGGDYIRTVCDAFDNAFQDSASFVFALPTSEAVTSLANTFNGKSIPISVVDVCAGMERMATKRKLTPDIELPTLEKGNTQVDRRTSTWIQEDMEIIHLSIGNAPPETQSPRDGFLQGMPISWFDLDMNYDVPRDKTAPFQARIESDLRVRSIRKHRLFHWPGAGGTTIARRAIWNLHRQYPALRLLRVVPNETIGRLRKVFDLTRLPLLVLVESSDVSESALDQLFNEAMSMQIPSVFLLVLRSFDTKREGDNLLYVGNTLSGPESESFAKQYTAFRPEQGSRLAAIANSPSLRNPFYYGLVACGRQFLSIADYVGLRLRTGTETQQLILTILAIAYHYGQKSVPAQVFANILEIPEKRSVKLELALSSPLRELVLQEEGSRWRPAHELVAEQLVVQTLAGTATDPRVWKQNLSVWACKFIDAVSPGNKTVSQEIADVLSRIFISRGAEELLGSSDTVLPQYAPIIEDIPSREGKLIVLRKLVEKFPTEPHYWGHLGRFVAYEQKDYVTALDAIDKAIILDGKNNIFYHIKGMVIRRQLYDILDDCRLAKICTAERLAEIRRLVDEAGRQYQISRELASVAEEHGYVSHIQMLIQAIDFGFTLSQSNSREEFLVSLKSAWYRELLDLAESLLEELKRKKEGQRAGYYVTSCQTRIGELYGDYSRVLQGWDNLLRERGTYHPPIRREIAMAYWHKRDRSWDKLTQRELARVAELMESNLMEDASDYRSIRIWFQAVRRIDEYSAEAVIERLSYWRASSKSIDAVFYLYILFALQSIDGSSLAPKKAFDMIIECSQLARPLAIRHNSIEWFGKGNGMRRLLHHSQLGDEWEEEFEKQEKLALLGGRVSKIAGPESGQVELTCGLTAFFVPGRGYKGRSYTKSQDENKAVKFYLAFTYDGLRAWAVRDQ